jgi:hypothetical protein
MHTSTWFAKERYLWKKLDLHTLGSSICLNKQHVKSQHDVIHAPKLSGTEKASVKRSQALYDAACCRHAPGARYLSGSKSDDKRRIEMQDKRTKTEDQKIQPKQHRTHHHKSASSHAACDSNIHQFTPNLPQAALSSK